MPKGQEGIFCVDSYSQSYFRKVSLNSGVQFPESFRQAVSVQERRLNSGCTIAPTCNVLSADNTSFLILLYRSRQRKAIRLIEKEEKIKTDSILIFRGISDTVKRKGFETEHEEKELLWISKSGYFHTCSGAAQLHEGLGDNG